MILSTNDMHASLENMARLATAVKECRDTVFTVVVDAGDRWTGNAYVDLAEGRLPMIRLMNSVGYDVVTLGNHDFDAGIETLDRAVKYAEFDVVCANIVADVIIGLAPKAKQYMKQGGIFITSGIIEDRVEDVKEALVEVGFEIVEIKQRKDWVSIICR